MVGLLLVQGRRHTAAHAHFASRKSLLSRYTYCVPAAHAGQGRRARGRVCCWAMRVPAEQHAALKRPAWNHSVLSSSSASSRTFSAGYRRLQHCQRRQQQQGQAQQRAPARRRHTPQQRCAWPPQCNTPDSPPAPLTRYYDTRDALVRFWPRQEAPRGG